MIHCYLRGEKHALAFTPLLPDQKPVAVGMLYTVIPKTELEKKADGPQVPSCHATDIAPYVYRNPVGPCRFCHAFHCTLTPTERFEASCEHCLTSAFQPPAHECTLAHFLLPRGALHNLFHTHIRQFLTSCPRLWSVPCTGHVWYAANYTVHLTERRFCWQYGVRNRQLCQLRWLIQAAVWPLRFETVVTPDNETVSLRRPYFSYDDQSWVAEIILVFLTGHAPTDLRPVCVTRKVRHLAQEAAVAKGKGVVYQILSDRTLIKQSCSRV